MLPGLDFTLPTGHGVATYPPGAAFGPRQMRDYEFVWLIEGDAEYRWNDQKVAAPQGSIVLCRPGAVDFFQWDRHRRTRHGFFHFDLEHIPKRWPAERDWPLVREAPAGEDILHPLFRYLLSWVNSGDEESIRLTIALMLNAFIHGKLATAEVPPDRHPQPVERAESYIRGRLETNPTGIISLDDLADAALVTPEHLCRLFMTSTGHSPIETVRLARLDRAATLIARSNYSLKEIAGMCGYSSPFHLSRRFSEAFGASPREVRRRIAAGQTPPLARLLKTVRGP